MEKATVTNFFCLKIMSSHDSLKYVPLNSLLNYFNTKRYRQCSWCCLPTSAIHHVARSPWTVSIVREFYWRADASNLTGLSLYRYNDTAHKDEITDTSILVEYEDGHWSKPYFDCRGGDIWMMTYTVPFFGYRDGRYHFKWVFALVLGVFVNWN